MPALAFDNFNRADAANLGANWTNGGGGSNGGRKVLGNTSVHAGSFATSDSWVHYSGRTWGNDQYSQGKVTVVGTTGGQAGEGVMVRSSGSARTHYRLVVDHKATQNFSLQKFVAATLTDLGQITQAFTDGDTIRLSVQGTTLAVTLNGVPVVGFTTTDSGVTTGSPGLSFSSAETSASVDDWEAGDLSDVEIMGRPRGLRGDRQMRQLLAT